MAFNVVRGTPRRLAAALITPSDSRRTRTMYSRSISASCAPGAFHRFGAQFRERSTEQGPLGKNDRSLKEVIEFPYIPGPRPAHQGLHYVRWHLVNPLVHFVRVFFGEVPDQYRYVRGMVAQPGRGDRKDFQAIV